MTREQALHIVGCAAKPLAAYHPNSEEQHVANFVDCLAALGVLQLDPPPVLTALEALAQSMNVTTLRGGALTAVRVAEQLLVAGYKIVPNS
jgi:hypothetical protein